MLDPIDPIQKGYILDVKRLKALLKNIPDDAEIVLRQSDGDTHIIMDEIEAYMADSSHPNCLAHESHNDYDGVDTLILDISKIGDSLRDFFYQSSEDEE
jgi:hypothetical protein